MSTPRRIFASARACSLLKGAAVALVSIPLASCGRDEACSPTDECWAGDSMEVAVVPQLAPRLIMVPEWRRLVGDGGATSPVVATIELSSTAGSLGPLATTISYLGPHHGWLHASLNGSRTPTDLVVSASPLSLPVGPHIAEVEVSVPGSSIPAVEFRLQFNVHGSARSITGGTVNSTGTSNEGTFFVWDARNGDGTCCREWTVQGRSGWNGGQPLPLTRAQPQGLGEGLALDWTPSPAQTGWYWGTVTGLPWRWSTWMDVAGAHVPPTIVDFTASPETGFDVYFGYNGVGSSRVSLFEVGSPSWERLIHDEMIPPNTPRLSIPETVEPGKTYRVEVALFSKDLTGPLPSSQVDMTTASASLTVAGVGKMELRPAFLHFETVSGQSPPPQTVWAHNVGTVLLVGHTYQHSNNWHGATPTGFGIQPGDSLQFTVNAFAPPLRPPGLWTDETLFLVDNVPGAPDWGGAVLKMEMLVQPAPPQ